MELFNSSLCAAVTTLGKKINEEIMSPDTVGAKSPGGPSKRTRQSMKKKLTEALDVLRSTMEDIIESTMEASKMLVKVIKYLGSRSL